MLVNCSSKGIRRVSDPLRRISRLLEFHPENSTRLENLRRRSHGVISHTMGMASMAQSTVSSNISPNLQYSFLENFNTAFRASDAADRERSLEMNMHMRMNKTNEREAESQYETNKRWTWQRRYGDAREWMTDAQLIGQGNFARVYKVMDRMTGQNVAIKVMDVSKAGSVIKQEEKVLGQIAQLQLRADKNKNEFFKEGFRHLGLPLDSFNTDLKHCFVFNYYRGGDFFDEIVKNGVLSECDGKLFLRILLNALAVLHENGFVHRDVKLENILIASDNSKREKRLQNLKLVDFGYAKHVSEVDKFSTPAGTLGYVAPEILEKRLYTPKCDIWSSGIVMFSALAGFHPFPHEHSIGSQPAKSPSTQQEMLKQELEAIRYGLRSDNWEVLFNRPQVARLSPGLKDLLMNMLEPDPEKRISSRQILRHPWMQQTVEELDEPRVDQHITSRRSEGVGLNIAVAG